MSGLFNVANQFMLVGEVVDKRSYKNEKSDRSFWYLKIAGKGVTFEVQVDRETYDRAAMEQGLKIVGHLGEQFQKVVLLADKVEPALAPSKAAI